MIMTELQIKDLGWKLVKQYDHDEFHTNRYKLGEMFIEFTYEGDKLLTVDVTINEIIGLPVSIQQIKQLTKLLGGWEN